MVLDETRAQVSVLFGVGWYGRVRSMPWLIDPDGSDPDARSGGNESILEIVSCLAP